MERFRTIWALLAVMVIATIASVAFVMAFVLNADADDSGYSVRYSTSDAKLHTIDPIVVSNSANTVKLESSTKSEETKLDGLKPKFAALVESGELTQAEADAKLTAILTTTDKSETFDKSEWTYEAVEAKLAALVASGELTQEQADKKLAWYSTDKAAVTKPS